MDLAQLLGAREQFSRWRQQKAIVLVAVEQLFPPKHALRVAVCQALCRDPLAACTLQADNAACRACDVMGEDEFRRCSGGLACTHGSKARADTADLPPQKQPHHSQWLGFADSVRALTHLPRTRAKIDACEAQFLETWRIALEALRHAEVDLSGAFDTGMALRRGLPPDICRQIFELAVPWPQFAGDGPARKRRRMR
jgi:hypothetical protein